jgi:hypothetical protein
MKEKEKKVSDNLEIKPNKEELGKKQKTHAHELALKSSCANWQARKVCWADDTGKHLLMESTAALSSHGPPMC